MQIFYIIDNVALIMQCFLKVTLQNKEKIKINKSHLLYRVLPALSISTGHKMQCPPPLASANYLE